MRHAHPDVPIPLDFDGIIRHLVDDHGQHFMTTGTPPPDPDEALEHQLEFHDRFHSHV